MLNPIIPQIFTFLEIEWNDKCEDSKNLSLKTKILDILTEIILKIGTHTEKFDFYIHIITSSLTMNELSEVYLTEVFFPL